MFCLLLLGLLTSRSSVGAEECSRFSVVWPQSAVPGQGTAVLVYVGSQQPVNVTLQLLAESREVLVQSTVQISGEGTVPISVPSQASGVLTLQTKLGCSSELCPTKAASQLQLVGAVRDVIIRPKSYYYKPGETIEFWVLALDHDLRLASDVTGSIYLVDPSGTKVALWEEVALDEGVKNFNVDLSEDARTGLWVLEVSVGPSLFTVSLNVSLARGSRDPVLPELPIAEEHFVELGFSREMRRRYKPALPFVGKVEAVSSEKAVRVRVKVLDNTTSIYSQDIEMSGGEGSFLVPAILSDSQVITLQAELVSVGGKEIDSHYVLAREPVYKWNSTSSCYLLVEGLQESLQPGDEAKAVVLSSCPCDRDLHYIVTTESHVTYWNEQRIPAYSLPAQDTLNGIPPLCRFNFTFTVEAVMAPVSHLLVYYVTDLGEPITDVISFDVKLFQRQVSVNLEQKKFWYPGETMDVQILSDLGSLVCLIGGRGADLHSQKINGGVEVELSEAGVGYIWDDCSGSHIVRSANPAPHHSVMADPSLEQLWLWHCFNYTSDIEAGGLRVNSPPEPGKWTMSVLSVSQAMGLRFSYPLSLTVFQPIDVEFRLPRAFRVGESLEVDIKIGNNLNTCVDVNALLTLSEGAHFLGGSQPFVAEKLRLGPHGATSLVVRVVATTPRYKNMTVEVSAYHSETCQSITTEASLNHSLVGTVIKVQSILVNPEGLVKTHIESAYFCANEQMVISTAEEFRYEFISAPRNREGIVLEVRAGSGVHIGLSEVQDTSLRMYQIVIGDLDNSVSWIGRGKHGYSVHLLTATSPGILSSEESRTFWLSWEHGVVAFGRGPATHQKTLLKWRMEKKMKVNFLGFASTWGKSAEIRIWNYNDEAGFSQVLHLDIPHSVLPGSEVGTLLVAGGLSLPSLKTSQRPSLAEFSSLATTISAIAPLIADEGLKLHLNQTKNSDRQKLIKNLGTNIQKLLLFKKSDHSFSDHHNMTSFWSSVEVLDLVSRVQSVMGVDPELVVNLKIWIRSHQQRDGSFRAHYMDMALDNSSYSELARTVATTADTLVALLGIGIENQKDSEAVSLGKRYLEGHIGSPLDGCTLAMLCHALVSVKSDHSAEALDRLKKASTNEEGEFGWPHPRDNSDWLYEEGTEQKKPSVATQLKEFKASLYTLMTYTQLGDLKAAEPVARYLFYRANMLETHTELILTAVKAFSQFGLLALDPNRWLTVSLATSGMELTDTLELRASTSPPQLLNLPSLPTKVFVYATGAGCATVQGRISYATYTSSKNNYLFDLWAGVTEEIMPRRNSIQELEGKLPLLNIKTCFKWKGSDISGVIRLEVHLFSGFELISVRPNSLDVDYGARGDRVWFVVSNVSSLCAVCIEFSAKSDFIIGRLRPAFVRVYPSGRADLAAELFFHTRRGSPLLAETSDDDLITWFGSARAGDSDSMSSDFSDICPCGERCLADVTTESPSSPTTQQKAGEDTSHGGEELSDFTDIIVFSDLHENLSTTEGELRTIEDITKELGFNSTVGGFTIEHNPDANINLDFVSTSRSLVTTEISIEADNKTVQNNNIEKKLKKPKSVKTKINEEKIMDTKSLDKRKKFQRTKHTDIKSASEIIYSTLAPVLKHVHLNATSVKLDPIQEHIIISNITDTPPTAPVPVKEVLNITVGAKYVNRELKETIAKPENEEDKVKPTRLNVVLSAEAAKVNSESFLELEEHSPLEILREGHTEMYQQQPAPGG